MMLILVGLITGILSGLAIGGGTLLVPFLTFFMDTEQHIAQGVALASFLPTAAIAVFTHAKQGNIKKQQTIYLIAGSIVGAIGGALLATFLQGEWLRKIFGVFLILMGIYEFTLKKKLAENENGPGNDSERNANDSDDRPTRSST